MYSTSVALTYEDGAITSIKSAPGIQDPPDHDVPALPPEWFAALALGRFDVATIDARVDDSLLAPQAELLDVLFPELTSDMEWVL